MMKSILITGASGFIGSFLVEEALKRNYRVFAAVRSSSNRTYLSDPRINFIETELSDKALLAKKFITHQKTFGKFDFVIHNAGITKSCVKSDFDKVNFQYTKNLIEALTETASLSGKFVFMSSLAAYGPGDEETLKPVSDSDTPHPVTLYGESKLKAERFIKSLSGFPFLIFRPTGAYGYREKDFYLVYKNIKQGIETYIGTTRQHLTFIYVKDLVRLIFDALESPVAGKSYFVSDLNYYTATEFNTIIKKVLRKKTIRIVFPRTIVKIVAFLTEKIACITKVPPTLNTEKYKEISCKNWLCDSTPLVNDFGFYPEYDLIKGLTEALTWYKNKNML